MDTPKKFSLVVSLLITDKLSHLELTNPSNYGILLLTVNSPVKPPITLNGYLVLDIPLFLKLKAKLPLNLTLPLLDGMEDSKFGTLISKLDLLSNPMMEVLTLLLSPLTPNILPLEEETNLSTSGMLLILENPLELLKLDLLLTKSNSTLNYNGSLPPLNLESKSGT